MIKRKTSKEIIEKGNPKTEQVYIKFPKKELIKISRDENEMIDRATIKGDDLYKEIISEKDNKSHFILHTHNYRTTNDKLPFGLPSYTDLIAMQSSIKKNAYNKGEIIAQRDSKTGEIQGYTFLVNVPIKEISKRKLSEFFKIKSHHYISEGAYQAQFYNYYNSLEEGNPKEGYEKLRKICDEKNWKLRFVPAKGYYFNKSTGNFEKGSGLEKNLVAGILFSIFGSLAVLSLPKINGFVFNNSNSIMKSNLPFLIGTFLFMFGLFFWVRKLRKDLK